MEGLDNIGMRLHDVMDIMWCHMISPAHFPGSSSTVSLNRGQLHLAVPCLSMHR